MGVLQAAEAAAESSGGGIWQLAMILAAIGILAFFSRWRKARTPPPVNLERLRQIDREPDRHRDAADKAIVELLETSRALNAQVDTRIRMLNHLLKDAGEQAARLEKLLAEARGVASVGIAAAAAPGRGPETGRPTGQSGPPRRTELQERICRLRNEGKTLTEIAKGASLSISEVRFALESLDGFAGENNA
ncbi:MAG: hypothetical protein LBU23_10590 [Planctomycetota bacterium]|jgi:hypothetical protein|nr:hypothetical protein [Planctomycetota bacterium]